MANKDLLASIDAFTRTHGMAESTFGREALNDWAFSRDLRAGRRVWPETEAKVRKFMTSYIASEAQNAA